MKKRIVCLLLVLAMVAGMIPFVASATEPEKIYFSVSFDGEYISDKTGQPIAYVSIPMTELEAVDLNAYGLGDYLYDADADGDYEITALHADIYVHTQMCGLDWSDVAVSGSAGSIFFERGIFGFSDCNLIYYHNGTYPNVGGMGTTADQIVLSAGDYLDVSGFTSWGFYGDSGAGFRYFTDAQDSITHTYSATVQQAATVKVARVPADLFGGVALDMIPEAFCDVSYGTVVGNATGTVTTDDMGVAQITFPAAGTWYVWSNGCYGVDMDPMSIVSSPACAVVTVEAAFDPDQEAADAVATKINAIGEVKLEKESLITDARAAYDALNDARKALVSNYNTLTAAETRLQQLKDEAAQLTADQAAADAVEKTIGEIGQVTAFSGTKVQAARSAYDGLTDSQKALVENAAVLTAAEAALTQIYAQAAKADHKAIYEATGKYVAGLGTPYVGSTGGEWMVIDLTRAGQSCPEGYYQNVVDFVKAEINDKEQLHRSKSTENSRVILALTASGYDVTDVDGHNLLMGLTDMTYIPKQGINGPIWALIAIDSHNYEIPVNPNATEQATREKLIAYILEKQLADGGWDLANRAADPDMTGMAIQALAPYYQTNDAVKAAVDKALTCLSNKQMANGGFGSTDGICTESCAQVIVALTALGIDPETDSRFIKNGMSAVDAMCLFAANGGGFTHVPNQGINGMATEQGQYALAAYFRFKNGQTALYEMSDVVLPGEAVAQKIAAIGTVTINSEKAITDARTAYDALSDYQKMLVGNYDVLTAAEITWNQLKTPGKVENETSEKENACAAKLDVPAAELAAKLLTKEEEQLLKTGVNISVELVVEDISKEVSSADRALVEKSLGQNTVGMYLDITLTKQLDNAQPVKVTQTNGAVTVTIVVPENLRNTDTKIQRTYKVIRVHNAKTDILDADYDAKTGKLSFQTDAFSTYALVYTDTAVAAAPSTPHTGDNTQPVLLAAMMLLGLCGAGAFFILRKRAI